MCYKKKRAQFEHASFFGGIIEKGCGLLCSIAAVNNDFGTGHEGIFDGKHDCGRNFFGSAKAVNSFTKRVFGFEECYSCFAYGFFVYQAGDDLAGMYAVNADVIFCECKSHVLGHAADSPF